MLTGIAILALAPKESSFANEMVSGPGTLLESSEFTLHQAGPILVQGPLHAAAVPPSIAWQMILGMLLIFLGFGLHALFVVRNEKPLRSPGLPKRRIDRSDLGGNRGYLEVFWIGRRQ